MAHTLEPARILRILDRILLGVVLDSQNHGYRTADLQSNISEKG